MTQNKQLDQVSICYPLTWWDAVVERWYGWIDYLAGMVVACILSRAAAVWGLPVLERRTGWSANGWIMTAIFLVFIYILVHYMLKWTNKQILAKLWLRKWPVRYRVYVVRYEARYPELHRTLKEEGRYKDGSGLPRRHNILEHIQLLESIVDGAGYFLDTYTSATSIIDLAGLETMDIRLFGTKEKYKELLGVVERGIRADELARGIRQTVAEQLQRCVICGYEPAEHGRALYSVHDNSLVCVDCLPLYQEAVQADSGDKLDDLKPEQIKGWLDKARALYTVKSMHDQVLGDGVIGKVEDSGE